MTAPAPMPDTVPPGEDDGVCHLYCCDPTRALRGLELTDCSCDADGQGDGCDRPICPLCKAVEDLDLPCGPDCKAAT